MSIISRIDEDIKKALKAGEKEALTALRGLKSDIKYKQIDKGEELTDDDVIAVLNSARKKRRDSIEQFEKGGRDDLVQKERFGLALIEKYLPEQISEEKLVEIIKKAIDDTGADSPAKIGLVMKAVMPQVKGQADGKVINQIAMRLLSQ
ncbi:MAG: GatB/YqeY domain-containing protein [Candidatus Zixiibacteriota bacterium]|nr:MAG: GatB/YqeY domain-containing protein [candidate division Zixibacteria bacterium]